MWLPSAIKQQCHWGLCVGPVASSGPREERAFGGRGTCVLCMLGRLFVLGRWGPFACWGPAASFDHQETVRCQHHTIKNARGTSASRSALDLAGMCAWLQGAKGVCANTRRDCFFCVAVRFVVIPVGRESVDSLGAKTRHKSFFFFFFPRK